MTRKSLVAALLAGTMLTLPTAAWAQDPAPAVEEPTTPDESDATADAAIQSAGTVDDMQAKIELLQAQVEALQEALEGVKTQQAKVTPSWKGAPQSEDKEAGWAFKIRGRLQYDVGTVSNPDDNPLLGGNNVAPGTGLNTRNLGFNARARRIRLGAEGTIPGGIGYKCEMDFANAAVGFGDCLLSYTPSNSQFNVAIGNQETNNGLEQISSSRWSSFIERAAFDDAFINTRRLGINLGYASKDNTIRLNAGLWTGHSIDASLDDDSWIGAARAVYAPLMGGNQMHFGVNYQHREFQSNNAQTASSSSGRASTNQIARYRARPFSQLTDVRFVDTGNYAAKSDDIFGFEAAGIFKSLHVAAEGQYLKSRVGYDPGDTFATANDLDQFVFNNPSGCSGSACTDPVYIIPGGNPSFWGGYFEAGYFLTGETRGYKNGTWDRTKVLNPFSKGGAGAFQINGRVDYLDLDSRKLHIATNNNFRTGAMPISTNYTRGGKQLGLQLGLTWIPEDYLRVLLNYSRAEINGGPLADEIADGAIATNNPDIRDVNYGVDVLQARFQVDF